MIVNEIFYSLQGEGSLAGLPSIFIRFAGCPLKCRYCDTVYAADYNDGEKMTVEQIINRVKEYSASYIVVTGGEPFVNKDMTERQELRELLTALKDLGKHITIETAGMVFLPDLVCDLMSISPKLPNAGSDSNLDLDSLQQLIIEYNCQFKFVVQNNNDLKDVEKITSSLAGLVPEMTFLMPQAATRDQYMETAPIVAEMCKQTGITFSPRLHILFWDNQPGR
jgi:7-carboxy-7-deazaguanine synthase